MVVSIGHSKALFGSFLLTQSRSKTQEQEVCIVSSIELMAHKGPQKVASLVGVLDFVEDFY